MCITFFFIPTSTQVQVKDWPFLLFFNREENIFRKTIPVQSLKSDQNILCARDLWRGGTWLALNKKTKNFAFLTNLNEILNLEFDPSKIIFWSFC
jgi:uncharacterized protein with NRDE domain